MIDKWLVKRSHETGSATDRCNITANEIGLIINNVDISISGSLNGSFNCCRKTILIYDEASAVRLG